MWMYEKVDYERCLSAIVARYVGLLDSDSLNMFALVSYLDPCYMDQPLTYCSFLAILNTSLE